MHLRRELVAFGATSHQAAGSGQWWLWLTKMMLGCCCQECDFSDPCDHLGLKMGTPQSLEMGRSQLGQLIRNEQSVSDLTLSCPEDTCHLLPGRIHSYVFLIIVSHIATKERVIQAQGEGDMQPQDAARVVAHLGFCMQTNLDSAAWISDSSYWQ